MEDKNKKPIKRVLFLADFACATGFAQVAQNIVKQLLLDKEIDYQIDVIGINYYGLPNEWLNAYPRVRLFPAQLVSRGDVFGRWGFLELLATAAYDIAFTVQDTFNIEEIAPKIIELRTEMIANGKKPFRFIFYYPIDATPKENWITKSVSLVDIPVAYTQYAADESIKFDESLRERLRIVPHGVEEKVFRPLPDAEVKEFRSKFFMGMADNKFLVTNVNRNQPRKDIARTMQIFRLFKNICPDALLYLHMKVNDVTYNLDEVARNYELIPEKDYIIPTNFDENQGMPVDVLNLIYNASDAVMTTTLGEGWGLSMTEAMAAGTPVIAPNHTSLTEMLGDGRGTLVTAGRTASEWFTMMNDNSRLRPLVNVAEYVDKLVWMHNNPEETAKMAEKARGYVVDNWTWDKVGQKWRDIFKTAVPSQKKVTIGRNDPCHCGSGKKFKKCHGE